MNIALPINLPIDNIIIVMSIIIFSCASLFFGAKLFQVIVAIIGVSIGLLVISPIIAMYTTNSNIVLFGGIISGIILALICIFFFYIGIAILGVFLGFMILKLLNIEITGSNQYITIIVITIITFVFILVAKQFTEIIVTSVIGGILLSNCLYFLYLYYIDKQREMDFNKYIEEIVKGNDSTYFTLLGVSLFLVIIGIIFQFKNNNRS